MKIIFTVLLFVAVSNALVFLSDTTAEAAAKLDQFFRSNYEDDPQKYRTSSLSYDEALIAAPAMMERMARYHYETKRKTYEATRKSNEGRALPYDEAIAFSRSG